MAQPAYSPATAERGVPLVQLSRIKQLLPDDVQDRQALLALAGYPAEKQIELVRKALETMTANLTAMKKDVSAWHGEVTVTEIEDMSLREAAARDILSFFGVKPQASGNTTFNVKDAKILNAPGWARPLVKVEEQSGDSVSVPAEGVPA